MFYAWCLPCSLLSVNFLNSIQTQLKLRVHMMCINPMYINLVSCVFRTKGKGLGHAHKVTCCPGTCKSSHVNPVLMSAMAITKVRLVIFCTRDFDFYCVPAHDSRHLLLSALLTLLIHSLLKLKF